MGTPLLSVHTRIESTMPRECATTAITHKAELNLLPFADTQIGWRMHEECAIVVIKRKSGRRAPERKAKIK